MLALLASWRFKKHEEAARNSKTWFADYVRRGERYHCSHAGRGSMDST